MPVGDFVRVATLRGVPAFREALASLGIDLPVDDALGPPGASALASPCEVLGRRVSGRFAVQPMEGWDGTLDGRPTADTLRRWRRFGASGAHLVWGGEAVAVRHDGRANPNQLLLTHDTRGDIAGLRTGLLEAHRAATDEHDDPVVGLQLTHSGRYARPDGRAAPVILYHHPLLDQRLGLPPDYPLMPDGEVRRLVADFARAARLARDIGFDFVDVKHCHGYLGHEFLSAHTREGDYGGSLVNRARFLREVVQAIRSEAPGLGIGVRVSAFDMVPYRPDPDRSRPGRPGPGVPETYCDCMPYRYGFGVDPEQPTDIDLTEPVALLQALQDLGVSLVNVTGGSPYYTPHIQRPALYPPSDGYEPPEDPLVGVARHLTVTGYLKRLFPGLVFVGTGYTYLQEFLPLVAEPAVRDGAVDFVGLGRMMLAYPDLPSDVLSGAPLRRKQICRTFSDCTTAPRQGLVSGCYPLDTYYRDSPAATTLAEAKRSARSSP